MIYYYFPCIKKSKILINTEVADVQDQMYLMAR